MKSLYYINKFYRRTVKAFMLFTISLLGIVVTSFLLLQVPAVQNFVAQKIVQRISDKLDTKVAISGVDIGFFKISLEDFYIEDQKKDTLLFAHKLHLNYDAFDLLSQDINIKNIDLEKGRVNLIRLKDEDRFNYAFIADALASDKSSSDSTGEWKLNLEKVKLKDIRVKYLDEPNLQQLDIGLNSALVVVDEIDQDEELININQILITAADVKHFDLPRYRPRSRSSDDEELPVVAVNPFGWNVNIGDIIINQSKFLHQNLRADINPDQNYFDPNNIELQRINLHLVNTQVGNDTIISHITKLNLYEPKGFWVDEINSYVRLTPTEWNFYDLLVLTPRSLIRDQFTFKYNTLYNFYNIVEEIKMDAHFRNSKIATEDLRFFAPGLPENDEKYLLNGSIAGTVNDLNGKDLSFKYGNLTEFDGSFNIFGLPNIKETMIDFTIDRLISNAYELEEILPFVDLPPNTLKLGIMDFSGHFTGFVNDFVAYGDLNTAIGFVRSDINMKLEPKGVNAQYSGRLSTRDFNLGYWMDEPLLGSISFDAKVNGSGLEWEDMAIDMEGSIEHIDFYTYTYNNIVFNGDLQKKFFSGTVDVKDPNLQMDFTGTVNLKNKIPEFKLTADVAHADLLELGLLDDSISVATHVDMDFRGSNINNIEGNVFAEKTAINTSDKSYFQDSIMLSSVYTGNGKKFNFESPIADLQIEGRYNTVSLPGAFTTLLERYYPSIPIKYYYNGDYQDFEFELKIKHDNTLTELILPQIEGIAGTYITGRFDNSSEQFILDASVPGFSYNNFKAENVELKAYSNNDSLFIYSDIKKISLLNGISISNNVLSAQVYNDKIYAHISSAEDSLISGLSLNTVFSNINDSLRLEIINSEFILAGDQWKIDKSNEIIIHNKNIYTNDLVLENHTQSVAITSEENRLGNNMLTFNLTDLDLGKFTSIINFKDFELDGKITGIVEFNNPLVDIRSLYGDFKVTDFYFNGDSLGLLNYKGGYDFSHQKLSVLADLSGKYADLTIDGYYAGIENEIDFDVTVDNAPFNLLEPYIEGVASDLNGYVQGSFNISGTPNNVFMDGKAMLYNGGAKIDYLNTSYTFEPAEILFTKNSIYISEAIAKDKNGRIARVGGEIFTKDFKDFSFEEVHIYTTDGFLFMETTSKDNDLFYGTAYGQGNGIITINGPMDNVSIYVKATSGSGTKILVPISYESGLTQYDFINFRQPGEDTLQTGNVASTYGIELNMDLNVTPDAEIQLIFDMQAGDVIKGFGEGNLKFNINTFGDFYMYGNYTIVSGDYLFTLQDFITKKFDIKNGSTITWIGDPYEAILNIDAIYKLRTSPYNLFAEEIQNEQIAEDEGRRYRQPVPVEVTLNLTGALSSPDIAFDINIPNENTYDIESPLANRMLQIRQNEQDLNKQVFGLIVMNQFLPQTLSGNQVNRSTGFNTVSEFVSNQLALYFNDWLAKYDVELNLAYRQYTYEDQQADVARAVGSELELELSKRFGRLYLNMAGNVDVDGTRVYENQSMITGDVQVEYSLTEDGRFRVRAFSENEYDIIESKDKIKSGLGLFYKKEFDSFKDLFSFGKKDKTPVNVDEQKVQPKTEPQPDEDAKTDNDEVRVIFKKSEKPQNP